MRKQVFTSIFCGFAAIALSFTVFSAYRDNTEKTTAPVSELPVEYRYILREYDGRVGVFEQGANEPVSVLNIHTENMTPYDRLRIQAGIEIKDDAALKQWIEDFDS